MAGNPRARVRRNNPPLPAITGDVIRITVLIEADSQLLNNTFDYMSTTLSLPQLEAALEISGLLQQFVVNVIPAFTAWLDASVAINAVTAAYLNRTDVYSPFKAPIGVGTGSGGHLPLANQTTCRRYTQYRGQHGRGRIQLGPIWEGWVAPATLPNNINLAGQAAARALIHSSVAPLVGSSYTWTAVVATRPVKPAFLVTMAAPITTVYVVNEIGTQRRRLVGRGK
jgi:hypothetical protein